MEKRPSQKPEGDPSMLSTGSFQNIKPCLVRSNPVSPVKSMHLNYQYSVQSLLLREVHVLRVVHSANIEQQPVA